MGVTIVSNYGVTKKNRLQFEALIIMLMHFTILALRGLIIIGYSLILKVRRPLNEHLIVLCKLQNWQISTIEVRGARKETDV